MADADEDALLARARGGDSAAFATLLAPHRARLWSICLRITGSAHDAEDALQEALTAVWLHLGSFRGQARLSTWMYRIAANAAIAVVRRRRDLPHDPWTMPEPGEGHRDVADGVVDGDAVRRGLEGLPPAFRECLVLREIGDLTYEEIAAHQEVGVQTVKSRLHRARTQLARTLQGPLP